MCLLFDCLFFAREKRFSSPLPPWFHIWRKLKEEGYTVGSDILLLSSLVVVYEMYLLLPSLHNSKEADWKKNRNARVCVFVLFSQFRHVLMNLSCPSLIQCCLSTIRNCLDLFLNSIDPNSFIPDDVKLLIFNYLEGEGIVSFRLFI